MAQVKIIFDPSVNSLTVWFDNPSSEDVSTDLDNDVLLMKNKDNEVIGVEKHFFNLPPGSVQVQFETLELRSQDDLAGHLTLQSVKP